MMKLLAESASPEYLTQRALEELHRVVNSTNDSNIDESLMLSMQLVTLCLLKRDASELMVIV